jgi:hypothetical protein
LHLARHRQPLQRHRHLQPIKSRRLRKIQSWRSLPRLREPPAVAPMVAQRASNTATNPGMDAPRRVTLFRQRAETDATTKPTWSAWTADGFWPGDPLKCGGIAAACTPRGSWPGRGFRSPNSSDQHVASPAGFVTSAPGCCNPMRLRCFSSRVSGRPPCTRRRFCSCVCFCMSRSTCHRKQNIHATGRRLI